MGANLFESNPFPLSNNVNSAGDKPLQVEGIATDRVDGAQNAPSGEGFLNTLAAVEDNLRVLDETIAELESIWAEDGHCS